MVYEAHHAFRTPPDSTRIWRYMKEARLREALGDRAFFFTRADQFEDQHEGAYPRKNVEGRAVRFPPGSLYTPETWGKLLQTMRWTTFLNCWHAAEQESTAMWSLYATTDKGVAIQSTVGRLEDALAAHAAAPVYIGAVDYIDYEIDEINDLNAFRAFLHKRREFEHEKEVRAVTQFVPRRPGPRPGTSIIDSADAPSRGINIRVTMADLIEAVVLSEHSTPETRAAVEDAMGRAGVAAPVRASSLSRPPLY